MYITGIDDCGRTSYIPHSNHILCGCLLPCLSAEDCTAVLRILSSCVDFDVGDEGVLPRFGSRVQQGKWRSGDGRLSYPPSGPIYWICHPKAKYGRWAKVAHLDKCK